MEISSKIPMFLDHTSGPSSPVLGLHQQSVQEASEEGAKSPLMVLWGRVTSKLTSLVEGAIEAKGTSRT
ncbi:unnamed protein product [Caretta caretta]